MMENPQYLRSDDEEFANSDSEGQSSQTSRKRLTIDDYTEKVLERRLL